MNENYETRNGISKIRQNTDYVLLFRRFFFYVDSGIFSTMDEKGLAGLDIGVMGVSHQSYKA